jgi:prophage tail gpP-like protein
VTALKDGDSEFDTITVRLPDAGIEITDIESIEMHSAVLTPTDTYRFTVDFADPATVQLLNPGARIEIAVNDRMQLTGFVYKKTITVGSGGGTKVSIEGRDIMGDVVDANVNPRLIIGETMTVADVFASVLKPLNIGTIYNDGALNVNLQTGVTQKPKLTTQNVTVQIPVESVKPDGTVNTDYSQEPVKLVNGHPPSLKTLQLSAVKPHQGEGDYQYLDRTAKRFGLRIHAAADGSGIIVSAPDFTTAPTHTFVHSLTTPDQNNVLEGSVTLDFGGQPGCIVASMQGAMDATQDRTWIYVIMINELVGTDANGQPLQAIKDILAQYPSARVLKLRPQLQSFRKTFADSLVPRPLFVKDSESRNIDQLEGYVRREMAQHQNKALHLRYTVSGLAQNGNPYATNTMVTVKDEVFGIDTNLYVFEREFHKARGQRTMTHLTLCLPYTVALQE